MTDLMIRPETSATTSRPIKLKGTVRTINPDRKTFDLRLASGKLVKCHYAPSIEDDVESAHNFNVIAAGTLTTTNDIHGRATKRLLINSIKTKELDFEAAGIKRRSIQDLLNSEIVGMWKDRDDMADVDEFVRKLRS